MDTPGIRGTAANIAGSALHAGRSRDRIAADRDRIGIEHRPNRGRRDTADTSAPLLGDSPGPKYSLSRVPVVFLSLLSPNLIRRIAGRKVSGDEKSFSAKTNWRRPQCQVLGRSTGGQRKECGDDRRDESSVFKKLSISNRSRPINLPSILT